MNFFFHLNYPMLPFLPFSIDTPNIPVAFILFYLYCFFAMARFNISPIKFDSLSFLILDCPSDKTLPDYVPILEEHNTTDLVRLCEGSPYNIQPLTNIGIMVHDDM